MRGIGHQISDIEGHALGGSIAFDSINIRTDNTLTLMRRTYQEVEGERLLGEGLEWRLERNLAGCTRLAWQIHMHHDLHHRLYQNHSWRYHMIVANYEQLHRV